MWKNEICSLFGNLRICAEPLLLASTKQRLLSGFLNRDSTRKIWIITFHNTSQWYEFSFFFLFFPLYLSLYLRDFHRSSNTLNLSLFSRLPTSWSTSMSKVLSSASLLMHQSTGWHFFFFSVQRVMLRERVWRFRFTPRRSWRDMHRRAVHSSSHG